MWNEYAEDVLQDRLRKEGIPFREGSIAVASVSISGYEIGITLDDNEWTIGLHKIVDGGLEPVEPLGGIYSLVWDIDRVIEIVKTLRATDSERMESTFASFPEWS